MIHYFFRNKTNDCISKITTDIHDILDMKFHNMIYMFESVRIENSWNLMDEIIASQNDLKGNFIHYQNGKIWLEDPLPDYDDN